MNAAPPAPDVADRAELPPPAGTMALEWPQLVFPYEHLRVRDERAERRLAATITHEGQRSAALVVRSAETGYALIDGYRRARVLRRMGRDTLVALAVDLEEAEALAYCHRLETTRRRSAVEDGWLVRELLDAHGRTPTQVAEALGRSGSWVSRRLGLVRDLPASVEAAVRQGTVPAHAAMKSLLPLARANRAQCETMVGALGAERLTTRQAATLYAGWRRGDAEQRVRIVEAPLLFLAATQATKPAAPPRRDDEAGQLARDLGAAAALVWRAKKTLERALIVDRWVRRDDAAAHAFGRVRDAYAALDRRFQQEEKDAG